MDLRLRGKRALITGSSTGIGAAIAWRLAAEGAAVLIHGRRAEAVDKLIDQIAAAGVLRDVLDNPTGRLGRPEDVADLVAYLVSPLADYVNGANLRVDGGSTACVN